MHPTILALAIPAFQDALFPRDSDVDDFLAKRFPAVLLQSNTLTKAGKIFVLVRDVPQDQLAKAIEEQAQVRSVAMVLAGLHASLTPQTILASLAQMVPVPGASSAVAAVGSPLTEIFRLRGLHQAPMSSRTRRLKCGCRFRRRW